MDAADGEVLQSDGTPARLHQLFDDRVAVLSLIYASCNDINGCPLATAVLHRLKTRLRGEADLSDGLRLVSLSFDPRRDTPPVMAKYGEGFLGPGPPWTFVTTRSPEALAPILAAYGQSVAPEFDESGRELGTLSHVLRVFLIDSRQRVRNIYSVSFLHSDTLIADIRTLFLEEKSVQQVAALKNVSSPTRDPRAGYSEREYISESVQLAARRGVPIDLLRHARRPRPGFAALPEPADNPLSEEKIALGRRLFFDRRLSLNGTISCAICHVPEQGFSNNELATSIGFEGRTVRRNAPTLLDVGYRELLFHDGRETRLEHQVWSPLLAANEMANPSIGEVLGRIRALEDYEADFRSAFPERGLAIESVGMALASYQRTLVSGPSPFDRWRYGGEQDVISLAAQRGFALFSGKAQCVDCHRVDADVATFDDGLFHNTGVGFEAAMGVKSGPQEVLVAPGQLLKVDRSIVDSVSERRPPDLGRYEITQDPADRWKYKTPSLRNVALTAPYMHDGSIGSLEEVVAFYARGGVPNPGLDPLIRPVLMSETERTDLVAFLAALTGDAVDALVGDAFAAPLGERAEAAGP
jgi:cytochrome c peroxidase